MAKTNNSNTIAETELDAFIRMVREESFAVTIGKREGNPVSIPVPVADMPANALFAMFAYGVQRKFNDAVGGSDKSVDDKVKAAREMIEAFTRGEVAKARGTGESVDPVTAEIRTMLRSDVKAAWIKANSAEGWKALEEDAIVAMLDAAFAEQDDETRAAIESVAKANLEAKAAIKNATKGLTGKLTLKV